MLPRASSLAAFSRANSACAVGPPGVVAGEAVDQERAGRPCASATIWTSGGQAATDCCGSISTRMRRTAVVAAPFDDRMEEARADGERHVDPGPDVVADLHGLGERMADVERAEPVLAHDHRGLQHLAELAELRLGAEHAAADEDRRIPRRRRGGSPPARSRRDRARAAVRRGHGCGRGPGGARGRDVRRNLDDDRPPAAAIQLPEGLVDDRRNGGRGVDPRLPFRHRGERPELVRDLVQEAEAAADMAGRDLAGDAKHRRIAGIGGRERRRRVEDARAGNHQAGAGTPGRLRIAEGHIGGRLLMARVDDPDRILDVVERVEDPVELQAGQAENGVDAVPRQRRDEDRRSGRLTGHFIPGVRCGVHPSPGRLANRRSSGGDRPATARRSLYPIGLSARLMTSSGKEMSFAYIVCLVPHGRPCSPALRACMASMGAAEQTIGRAWAGPPSLPFERSCTFREWRRRAARTRATLPQAAPFRSWLRIQLGTRSANARRTEKASARPTKREEDIEWGRAISSKEGSAGCRPAACRAGPCSRPARRHWRRRRSSSRRSSGRPTMSSGSAMSAR